MAITDSNIHFLELFPPLKQRGTERMEDANTAVATAKVALTLKLES